MTYGLIGERLGHSFSPDIHRRIGDYPYELCELAREELAPFFAARNFAGVNVTIPYKQDVIPLLDEIDPHAAEIGAVNTVVNREGRLCGYNTDFDGLSALILHIGVPLSGKRVYILGTGGTSRTACAVARAHGAASVLSVGRDGKGDLSYDALYDRAEQVDYIINTTPVGMHPKVDDTPLDLTPFSHLAGLCDVIYNPLRTTLVLDAQARGIPAEGGLYMLAAQAVHAARHFDVCADTDASVIDRVFCTLRSEKENIVLIGMPGAGKSTLGRALAAALDRLFLDSDEEVKKATCMPLCDYIETRGERAFRWLERIYICALSQHTGAVIATGGGAVLLDENVKNLKRTGRIYYLDRPLDDIRPTPDRPLSRDREALAARYRERAPIYEEVADCRVPVMGTVEDTLRRLLSVLTKDTQE